MLDSKRNNQSEWLKAYKKECVQLNASLNNLTEKQLKKLSRLVQNRCRKLISSCGFKDERSKSGTEIISLSENIKDEYKFTFWKSVYLYLVEKDSSDSLKLTPKLPTDLNTIIFKAVIYELVFPDQADQVWDEFVGSQCFKNYLKTFSQKNINNNLTSMDDSDFLDQIEDGYIPMMKELPVSELRRKYKDNI